LCSEYISDVRFKIVENRKERLKKKSFWLLPSDEGRWIPTKLEDGGV